MRDRDDIVIIAWAVWWGLLAFLVAAALVYVTVRPARAHTTVTGMMFDTWCCNGNNVNGDCQPIPEAAVKPVTGGYQVTLLPGMHPMVTEPHTYFMPQDKVRLSTDGLVYACLYPTEAELRCLYMMPEGS